MIVFDIETGPLESHIVAERAGDFKEPKPPGEFDTTAVKTGNFGPEKAAAKIEAARRAHEESVADHGTAVVEYCQEWLCDALDKAALSPLTGRVVAIGYLSPAEGDNDAVYTLDIENHEAGMLNYEVDILRRFWRRYGMIARNREILVGHGIYNFDVPFLLRRSWLHGITVPEGVMQNGRFVNRDVFVDTMDRWTCGRKEYITLDALARAMGVGGKPDGVDGSMFADMLKTDRKAAEEYLRGDLDMPHGVAEKMGIL